MRAAAPFGSGSFDSDVGFRFGSGRLQGGASMSFFHDVRGVVLHTVGYLRYVAPTYHVGLSSFTSAPLSGQAPISRGVTASAGIRPSAASPAFRVASSIHSAGGPRVSAGMFGTF